MHSSPKIQGVVAHITGGNIGFFKGVRKQHNRQSNDRLQQIKISEEIKQALHNDGKWICGKQIKYFVCFAPTLKILLMWLLLCIQVLKLITFQKKLTKKIPDILDSLK